MLVIQVKHVCPCNDSLMFHLRDSGNTGVGFCEPGSITPILLTRKLRPRQVKEFAPDHPANDSLDSNAGHQIAKRVQPTLLLHLLPKSAHFCAKWRSFLCRNSSY